MKEARLSHWHTRGPTSCYDFSLKSSNCVGTPLFSPGNKQHERQHCSTLVASACDRNRCFLPMGGSMGVTALGSPSRTLGSLPQPKLLHGLGSYEASLRRLGSPSLSLFGQHILPVDGR